MNFLGNWLGTFTAPYFINPASLGWSAKYGYIWAGSNFILLVFTWFFLPETKDRTLEEVHEMFENKVPARKFKTYVCSTTEAFAAEAAAGKLGEVGGSSHVEETEKDSAHAEARTV